MVAAALQFMKVDVVDLLVLGLPVAHYLAKKAALEKAMTGSFEVGRKRRVVVARVLVVVQPQGALFDHAQQCGQHASAGRNLVVDAGARTFDWLVTRGLRVITRMSSSVDRGVCDILIAIAERLSAEIREQYRDLEAIDAALRNGGKLEIYQKEYDLRRFLPLIQKVADQAVVSMVQDGSAPAGAGELTMDALIVVALALVVAIVAVVAFAARRAGRSRDSRGEAAWLPRELAGAGIAFCRTDVQVGSAAH